MIDNIDLLIKIFSYFDEITILRGRCVNKLWNDLLTDSIVIGINIWNPTEEIIKGNTREVFLESCKIGSLIRVNYISSIISRNPVRLKGTPHDLWNDGLVIASKNNHIEIVKLMVKFGISYSKVEALEEAVKNNSFPVIDFLLQEFSYNIYILSKIFNN
jgi:ankyrin repeat protein